MRASARSSTRPKQSAQAELNDFARAKLRRLIPLLSSDKDGEVVATVHAIRRTLAAADLDLHDLARLLTPATVTPASAAPEPERPPEPPPKPDRQWAKTVIELLRTHAECPLCLTDWERKFLANLASYHTKAPSAAQLDILDGITAKVGALHA
jgi:hypothetical protein